MSKKIIYKIKDLKDAKWFKDNNIKFLYYYPINTYFELNSLIELGAEYAIISAPLSLDLKRVKKIAQDKIKLRLVPNVAYDAYIPKENGIIGQWVRPEDVDLYEEYIYIFDFENLNSRKQEQALFDIYKNKKWNGNLKYLITNLNYDIDNKALDILGEKRINCGMRCQIDKKCNLCYNIFNMINNLEKRK